MKWTFEFDECGGYDCMSSAFQVKRDGKKMFVVDQTDFGDEEPCTAYEEMPEVRKLTEFIVESLNKNEGGRLP